MQALAIAVVGVRTFALGRALLRYLERLAAHDAALRMLAGLRTQVFAALRSSAPPRCGGYRRGDLLRRFVGDVDGAAGRPGPGRGAAERRRDHRRPAACVLAGLLVPAAGVVLAVALVLSPARSCPGRPDARPATPRTWSRCAGDRDDGPAR